MKHYVRILIFVLLGSASAWADAQCGSYSGSDGQLNITAAGVTVLNPVALGLNPSGDNVFQFTTINIAQGSTLKLTSEMMRSKPVVFCASGTVTIAGVLDLSGAPGTNVNTANPWLSHTPAQPGPGGFAGGLGGVSFQGVTASPTSGFGSGAPTCNIAAEGCWGAGAAHATTGTLNQGYSSGNASGNTYGNAALNPLTGGSGGNGNPTTNTGGIGGGNGGAGGGAIRIVSATSISINGSILAKGGQGGAPDGSTNANDVALTTGGSGSGGDIHLIAPTISGTGTLDTSGGPIFHGNGFNGFASGGGGEGWILLNTNTFAFTGALNGLFFSGPYIVPTPVAPPIVTITSVNGVSAPANPGGDPTVPDVTIAANAAVPVTITASQVPLGTVVTLTLVPTTGAAVSAQCNPLAGTTGSSTASCSVTFPTGVSLAAATATW